MTDSQSFNAEVAMPRVSKQPEVRRSELIDAAERLYVQQGYDETPVRDIVRASAVAQGTFYYYFKTKEDVLDAVIEKNIAQIQYAAEFALAKSGPDPRRQLQQVLNTLLGFKDIKNSFYRYLHLEKSAVLHRKFNEELTRVFVPLVGRIIAAGTVAGQFVAADAVDTAEILLVIIEHLNDRAHLSGRAADHDRRKTAAEHFAGRLLGLKAGQLPLDF